MRQRGVAVAAKLEKRSLNQPGIARQKAGKGQAAAVIRGQRRE